VSEEPADRIEAEVDGDLTSLDSEPSEVLDEDRLDADPLEDGMDAPEGYSRDVRLGGTQEWETEPPSIDYRLPQEEPELEAEEPPDRPLAATPIDELDESVDDPENAVDGVGGATVLDAEGADGATEAERLADEEVELGLSSANGGAEPTGLPGDDRIGEVAALDNEPGTVEEQAVRVEQER
jgi:hypothetical protein